MNHERLNYRRILYSTRWLILAAVAAHLYGVRAWPVVLVCLLMWLGDKGE